MSLFLTIVLFILIFGLIIILHEAGHFIMAKREGMGVREFAFGFPPRLASLRKSGTQFSLNLIPLGGYVSILGEETASNDPKSFSRKDPWARFRVVVAGVTMNLLLSWLLLTLYFWIAPLTPKVDAVAVANVIPNSAAAHAGIQVDDFIVSANGQAITSNDALSAFTRTHRGATIDLVIRRDGTERHVTTTLGLSETAPLGVSIAETGEIPHVPWYLAPWSALVEMGNVFTATLSFLGKLILRLAGGPSDVSFAHVSGPVGIFAALRQIQILGLASMVHFTAMISLAVAIFNLIPFPALDGGRAVLLAVEGFTKKRVLRPEVEAWVHAAGFALLILLILVVTYFDIRKLG